MATKEYFDIISWRKRPGQEKAYPLKIGSALKRDDGGFECFMDALPIPDATGCKISIMPPRDKGSFGGGGGVPRPTNTRAGGYVRGDTASGRADDLNDEIPF